MNRITYSLAMLVVMAFLTPHAVAGSVVVDKNNVTKTYDCAGGAASINGNRNILTLSNCSQVSVAGNYNQITLSGDSPDLSVPGNDNHVVAGNVKKISTLGNKNIVTWTSPKEDEKPSILNPGTGNSISRLKEE